MAWSAVTAGAQAVGVPVVGAALEFSKTGALAGASSLALEEAAQVEPLVALEACLRVFAVRRGADVGFLGLRRLPASGVQALLDKGFCIVDDFVAPGAAAEVLVASRTSLDSWIASDNHTGDSPADGEEEEQPPHRCGDWPSGYCGLRWQLPLPRSARGDYIACVRPQDWDALPAPIRGILEALHDLLDDLQTLAMLTGSVEMQLAWYPSGSTGYMRHTDAAPGASGQRQFTAVVYCNGGWQPGHGGELRLWPPLHSKVGGDGTVSEDVEPRAGRLVLFLSGCMPHEVLPNLHDRVAITMWAR